MMGYYRRRSVHLGQIVQQDSVSGRLEWINLSSSVSAGPDLDVSWVAGLLVREHLTLAESLHWYSSQLDRPAGPMSSLRACVEVDADSPEMQHCH
jgi:hypothetical protein